MSFDMGKHSPPVVRLPLHLPNQQTVVYEENDARGGLQRGMTTYLTSYFDTVTIESIAPLSSAELLGAPAAGELSYADFPSHYTWDASKLGWKRRRKRFTSISRIYNSHPKEGERYYLRILLLQVKGAKSFKDLRSHNGRVYPTFQEACYSRGYITEENEWKLCLEEEILTKSPSSLRHLFALIVIWNNPAKVMGLWQHPCADGTGPVSFHLSEDSNSEPKEDACLRELLRFLRDLSLRMDASLSDFGLPEPLNAEVVAPGFINRLIAEERTYDVVSETAKAEASKMKFNDGQREVYTALNAIVFQLLSIQTTLSLVLTSHLYMLQGEQAKLFYSMQY